MQLPDAVSRNVTSPLAGSTTPNLVRLLWRHRASIDNWTKALSVLGVTAALSPARAVERAATRRALADHRIESAPFFVVGFPRSGTTHLFRMLARDPQFGFLRWRQNVFPSMCATARPVADALLGGLGPGERPMDGMTLGPDDPEEEDGAVGNLTGFFAGGVFHFPRHAQEIFQRWALMRDVPPRDLARWEAARDAVFTKASWLAGGKRLVSKDPWNTARLPHIRRRWPDAPFLHIVRHPCAVYLSALSAIRAGAPLIQLCDVDDDALETLVLGFYRDLMQAHLEQRSMLGVGQYAELRYEDLVTDPLGELRRVYEELDLSGWPAFEPRLRSYLAEVADYAPNRFDVDAEVVDRVAREWRFAFDQWGYVPDERVDAGSG